MANGGKVALSGDITLTESLVIEGTVVLDLNGKKLTIVDEANNYAIRNIGNLTLKDTVGTGSVSARGIYNGYDPDGNHNANATLTILSGTYNAMGANGGAAIFNYGVAEIKGGSFTSIGGYSLNNQSGSKMTIESGVTANNGIYTSNATLTVNGGEISGNRSGCHVVYAWNTELTINGGNFYNNNSGNATIMAAGTTKAVINGGTFGIKKGNTWTSCLTDTVDTASLSVNGGTFNGGFRVQANTTMTINGGSFNDCTGSSYNINSTATVTVKGGTFTDDTAKAFAANEKYLAEDYELRDETVVYTVVATVGTNKYTTLEAAIAAATAGDTIVLTKDVALSAPIVINEAITLDLNGKTVTGTAKDMFRPEANFTVKNGTLINNYANQNGRCINTRSNVNLTVDNVDMKVSQSSNAQALLIGGNAGGTVVSVSDCSIDAGTTGYSICSFVKCNVDVTNSNLIGHGNIYLKEGSDSSTVNVSGSSVLTASAANDGSDFGSIVFENSNNSAVTVASAASINAGEYAVIFSRNGNGAYQNTVNLNGAVTAASGIVKNYVQGTSTVTTTNDSVKTALEAEGYALNETSGVYTVSGLKADEVKPTVDANTVTGATGVDDDVVDKIKQDIVKNENIEKVETNLTAKENEKSINNAAAAAVEKLEVSDSASVVVTGIDTTVKISAPKVEKQTTIEVNGEDVTVPKEMTFDVTLVAITTVTVHENGSSTQQTLPAEPVEDLAKPVTFRLPVSSLVPVGTMANVYHKGVPVGIHEVKGDNKGHYIEVTSQDFSPFKVSLLLEGEKGVASIDGNKFVSLQDAIDAATAAGGGTITLIDNVEEAKVLITQTEGVNLIIDGQDNTFKGTMVIYGQQRDKGAEKLLIQDINFVAPEGAEGCIVSPSQNDGYEKKSYSHNVTVSRCDFSGGSKNKTAAIRMKQGEDRKWIIDSCTASGNLHSFIQAAGVQEGLTITNCTVSNLAEGINLNQTVDILMEGNTISAEQYAVRIGASTGSATASAKILEMNNNILTATASNGSAVIVRCTALNATVNMEENTVSGATHISGTTEATKVHADKNYWDGKAAPVISGTKVPVASYYADAARTDLRFTTDAVAQVDNESFLTIEEAVAAAGSTKTIVLLQDVPKSLDIASPYLGTSPLNIDLNGKTLNASFAGTLTMNGGTYYNHTGYEMIAPVGSANAEKFAYNSTDGVFEISNSGITVHSGYVTIGHVGGTGTQVGHKLTLKSGATMVIPAGKNLALRGEGVVESGANLTTEGTIYLEAGTGYQATLTAPAGLKVAVCNCKTDSCNGAGLIVAYDGTMYKLVSDDVVATVGSTTYTNIGDALQNVPDGGTVYLAADVNVGNINMGKNFTLDLNGKTLTGKISSTKELTVKDSAKGISTNLPEGGDITYDANGTAKIEPAFNDTNQYRTAKLTHIQTNAAVKTTFVISKNNAHLTMTKDGVVAKVIAEDSTNGKGEITTLNEFKTYNLVANNNVNTYVHSSSATLTFTSNMFYETFSSLHLDGSAAALTPGTDYTAAKGSTVVTLTNSLLRKLSVGSHTLTMFGKDGKSTSVNFYVSVNYRVDTTNPKTGDEIALPMFVLFSSTAALAVLLMGKKKFF